MCTKSRTVRTLEKIRYKNLNLKGKIKIERELPRAPIL